MTTRRSQDEDFDLVARLNAFVRYRAEHLTGDEKGEAQVFLERLFRAFGHDGLHQAGAKLEMRVARRSGGGTAFADLVWKPRVLVEMKKAGQDLGRHYQQAFEYWIDLVPDRPQYVVLCNFDEFWIYDLNLQLDEPVDRVHLSDLARRWEALAFLLPQQLTPVFQNDLVAVTREAAATVVRVTHSLIERGIPRDDAQRFTMQCVMAMFSEDIGLLPRHVFTRAIEDSGDGGNAYDVVFGLFREMNTPGVTPAGRYKGTPYFNGGLFQKVTPFDLQADEVFALHHAASGNDWSAVRPEIFGTLFEQSMSKGDRHAYGAHFTSGVDIQKIVLPTIVKPWRERIEDASTYTQLGAVEQALTEFRVLDPACGCGNFLYVAYRELKKLEVELWAKARSLSKRRAKQQTSGISLITPQQFFGIDVNEFAVEIARLTMMLAKELAAVELDAGQQQVLPLDDMASNIVVGDALFMDWPRYDACIGNPPYLGRRRLIEERGAKYASALDQRYPEVKGAADYVVYWFRKAHDGLPAGGRAGLVGTNTIRQTTTRAAGLDYIIDHGGSIVDAWSTQPWSGDAVVHVSIVNWIKGSFDGRPALWLDDGNEKVEPPVITGSLSTDVDLRGARIIRANQDPKICFQGQTPGHTKGFVLTEAEAELLRRHDPKSASVLYPYLIGDELLHTGRPGRWVIDFATDDPIEAQAQAPLAFDRLKRLVLPDREAKARVEAERNAEVLASNPKAKVNWHHRNFLARWWKHSYRREELLSAVSELDRYIVLSRVASNERRPVFAFIPTTVRAGDAIQCFAFDDLYHFGVLQSTFHEQWFRGRCSSLKADPRYTASTVYDTFPWPISVGAVQRSAVESAARDLLKYRQANSDTGISLAMQYDSLRLPGRSRLRRLHNDLDDAVRAAYGFGIKSVPLLDLLAMNDSLSRSD